MPLKEQLLPLIGCALIAYLAGALNLSILAANIVGLNNLRTTGSGNPGATNLFRAAGAKVAVPVLILEILKAAAAINLPVLVGLSALKPLVVLPYLIGNLFPVFHGFKGGKGVAAVVGAMLGASPPVMLLGGVVFLVLFALFRRVSVGSLSMVIAYPVWGLVLRESALFVGVSCAVAAIVATTHRANIVRILNRTEPRLERRKG